MARLRRLLDNRALCGALLALALAMKLLVPGGFMPAVSGGTIVIRLCSGTGPMAMAMPGLADDERGEGHPGKAEQPCAFGGLAAPALGAIDPVLLAVAIAFILALALHPVAPRIAGLAVRLRPPLRGPPAGL